ncbi:TPA: hypothetical protein HA265_00855 [Candidatus Woesearchaeota archaeon]|nr:hypothetical protein [Candidatus Woesearchaeota archaeon]
MKKAQIAGQVFIYIIAIVVVGLIMVYGYSAIKGFTQKGEQVEYITLKTNMENAFKSIVSDYGSVKRPELDIPGKYRMVCLVDKDAKQVADTTSLCRKEGAEDPIYEPVVCSSWKIGNDNVYLIPDGSESWDVGKIVFNNQNKPYSGQPFICFD